MNFERVHFFGGSTAPASPRFPPFSGHRLEGIGKCTMKNYGKRYTKEFKEEAVRLLLTGAKSAQQLGRELGVSGMSLANWREEAIRNGDLSNHTATNEIYTHSLHDALPN